MRKITQLAIQAFNNAETFKMGNTSVEVLPNVTVLKLHNNEIAYRYNNPSRTLSITMAGWETNTTKERLNALDGVRIQTVNGDLFLDGTRWDGKLIDI